MSESELSGLAREEKRGDDTESDDKVANPWIINVNR